MSTEAQAGYLETDDGSLVAIALYMNNGVFASPEDGIVQAKDDTKAVLSEIQAALWLADRDGVALAALTGPRP